MTIKARRKDIQIANRLLRPYKFKINIVYVENSSFSLENSRINMDYDRLETKQEFWSSFYHEFAHLICTFDLKYIKYHWSRELYIFEYEDWKPYYRKMALKIETYVDKLGEKMFYKHFKKMEYKQCYRTKYDKEFLKRYYRL